MHSFKRKAKELRVRTNLLSSLSAPSALFLNIVFPHSQLLLLSLTHPTIQMDISEFVDLGLTIAGLRVC